MRIQYLCREGEIEIIRCYGTEAVIVLPEQIDGLPVGRIAAYAFSARKREEQTDVAEFTTETHFLIGEDELMLAGEQVRAVVLPDSVHTIGNYVFYGCKELETLTFSDKLMDIGSGAFTGCGHLRELCVRLQNSEKSSVKEILGDLWQRIDVSFVYRKDMGTEEVVNLVFPEHYEEAVENTPARILFTQHHGTGNNYRQCFYAKEIDYRKYDELFPLAVAQDKMAVLTDLVFARLEHPRELTEQHRAMYEDFVKEHLREIAAILLNQEQSRQDVGSMSFHCWKQISQRGLWTEEILRETICRAADCGVGELTGWLMNESSRLYPQKKKKNKFAL